MRAGLSGIFIGLSMAIGLKNDKKLSSSVITISLASEIMTIIIFGLIDIS